MKSNMAPINVSMFPNQDMDFNYIMLTTAEYYRFFSFCSHGLILLLGIFHGS